MDQEIKKYKTALKKAAEKIEELSTKVNNQQSKETVAIIGYSCRFPGEAYNPEGFWNVLENGIDTVTDIKADRFDYQQYYSDHSDKAGTMNTTKASFLKEDIKWFDNTHFGLTAIEASSIDPQHRLLLEVSWEAFENSALNAESLRGSRTGVFIGINSYEYANAELFSGDSTNITPYSTAGVSLSSAAGRLSYYYDFTGPAITCDTACSSSITALSLAVDSLQNHQCDLAIVGGSNLLLSPESFVGLSSFNSLSQDGRCKAFDESADGFGRGEGCGVVILKRYEEAKLADDEVVALIKGVAIGQDGKSNGYTAPNGLSQQKVIQQALSNANLSVEDIDYIETHGTGTPLGDLIEVQALSDTFRSKKEALWIGSVKTNIGHLEAASGMASLIKVIMSIQKKKIPASIHFKQPNQNINWDKVQVINKLTDWTKEEGRRCAGISSFGFSGTLTHAIIEEPPIQQHKNEELPVLPMHVITLSGKHENSLRDNVMSMKSYLLKHSEEDIGNIAYTTNISRSYLNYRCAIAGGTREKLLEKMDDLLNRAENSSLFAKTVKSKPRIAFLFTGQGSIYRDIAKDLYLTSKPFKTAMDVCHEKFQHELGITLLEAIYGERFESIHHPLYSQPIIFSVEYALTQLWESLGIKPDVVIGHSIGEYVAACYSGLITLNDAIHMIAQRGKMMESIDIEGKMVGILTNAEQIQQAIDRTGCKNVSIAAINAPENVTISGWSEEIDQVVAELQSWQRVFVNQLNISHPYHSSVMSTYEQAYSTSIGEVTFHKPKIDFISSITGKKEDINELGRKQYWVEHLSKGVNFLSAMTEAQKYGVDIFIEIGGDSTLSGLGTQCIDSNKNIHFVPSLRKGLEGYSQLFDSISSIYLQGVNLNWKKFHENYLNIKMPIPNYSFQKKKLWREVNNMQPISGDGGQKDVKFELKEMIKVLTWLKEDEIEDDTNLFMLGFDSLVLVSLNKQISRKYDLNISLNEFFTNLDTVEKISNYISANSSLSQKEQAAAPPEEKAVSAKIETYMPIESVANASREDLGTLHHVFMKQMEVMNNQLQIIKAAGAYKEESGVYEGSTGSKERSVSPPQSNTLKPTIDTSSFVPFKALKLQENASLDRLKAEYIKDVEQKYIHRSIKSKQSTQHYRSVYANNRNVAGFRPSLKEMIYQIIAEKADGSKLQDIDGHKLIDLTMGFGVNLFGHNPAFIKNALQEELDWGMPLGPMGRLAGKVAQQISELTGVERVAFYNSGTEANMVAVRLARAITGKKKIVTFAGSYHGTYDGLLGLASYKADGKPQTIPLAPGILDTTVQDLVILQYDSAASLEYIQEHAGSIAGVLVETVQSRKPDLQPETFLHQLRAITESNDIALIFDEVITGFRISAGGAQEYFGIQADIITYGKVVGGGMPIGIVSGKSKYMDSIDGGMWQYGDQSFPPCEHKRTFVAGTFSHHPLAMAAASATLQYIKTNKDVLYTKLNQKTSLFVARINSYFASAQVPIKIVHFGSLFRFVFQGDFEIFFYGLLAKGIYIWEGRNCFFSTAHTEEDIEEIVAAIIQTVEEMKRAGFFGEPAPNVEVAATADVVRPAVCPMSNIQQRLYAQSIVSSSDPNTIVSVLTFKGKLDCPKLEAVIQHIIKRHESLRTSLLVEAGDFLQKVWEHVEFNIEVVQVSEESVEAEISGVIQQFNLDDAPLFKVTMIYTGDQKGVLVFQFHHTIADGFSMNIFVQELSQLYQDINLELPATQYREFVEWEQSYTGSIEMEKDEIYWRNQLSDGLTSLNLPADFPASTESSFSAATIQQHMDADMVRSLRQVAGRHHCSIFMLLVAGYNILLHKVSGNEDIVIGTPASIRDVGNFEHCIGMFANTIVLRNKLHADQTLKQILTEVRDRCLEAYSHSYYPYKNVINHHQQSAGNQSSLINTMFIYEKSDQRVLQIDGVEITQYAYDSKISDSDFTLEILEEDASFQINFTYKTGLFKEETVARWGQYYQWILAQFLNENPDKKLKAIELYTADEKTRILYEFNNPIQSSLRTSKTIVQMFEEQVIKTPDQLAIVTNNGNLTYMELNERANQLARLLQEKKVTTEIIVAVMTDRSLDMIVSILAVLKAGGAYLPIDIHFPADRIDFMLNDSGCTMMLTQRALSEGSSFSIPQICVDEEKLDNISITNLEADISPNHLAYVIYTSGSTGNPKGVMIEHRNVSSFIQAIEKKIDFQPTDRMACLTTVSFDIFGLELFAPLTTGMQIYLFNDQEQKNLLELKKVMYSQKINVIQATPSKFNVLIQSIQEDSTGIHYLQDLKMIFVGGEELQPVTYNKLRSLSNARIYNMYGPTEATIWATMKEFMDDDLITIGKPLPNCKALILNEQSVLQPIGVVGELYISGEAVGRGYLNKPELTAQRFVANPYFPGEMMYRTGDMAKWTGNGEIQFLGRADHQVKIRGNRIELGEIENQLLKDPHINEAIVIDRKDQQGESYLCAYIVSSQKIVVSKLRGILGKGLPDYMIPSYFIQLDQLPQTLNEKIDRKALPDPYELELAEDEYEAPQNETEAVILSVWEEVLGCRNAGISTDFFLLGGDSIKAIQIVSKLIGKGFQLEVEQLYSHPTVKTLANLIVPNQSHSISGEIPYSPGLIRMAGQEAEAQKRWIQAAILYQEEGIQADLMKQVLDKLCIHHDALRIVLKNYQGKLLQINRGIEGKLFDWRIYTSKNADDMLRICNQIQDSIEFDRGPLIKAALFKTKSGDSLFIAAHHCIADDTSWDILLEDIEQGYAQALREDSIDFGAKTSSYQEWSYKMKQWMETMEASRHVAFSNTLPDLSMQKLPRDGSRFMTGGTNSGNKNTIQPVSADF